MNGQLKDFAAFLQAKEPRHLLFMAVVESKIRSGSKEKGFHGPTVILTSVIQVRTSQRSHTEMYMCVFPCNVTNLHMV